VLGVWSADFRSAVSPIFNRQSSSPFGTGYSQLRPVASDFPDRFGNARDVVLRHCFMDDDADTRLQDGFGFGRFMLFVVD
jgi:hypothetical protein